MEGQMNSGTMWQHCRACEKAQSNKSSVQGKELTLKNCQKAAVTVTSFIGWFFYSCFMPQVKKYLQEERLEFKVLLIMDNAPSQPELL